MGGWMSNWENEQDEIYDARKARELQQKAESERIEKELQQKAESERIEKELQQKSESERIEKELQQKAESERIEKELQQKAESERIEKELQKKAESEKEANNKIINFNSNKNETKNSIPQVGKEKYKQLSFFDPDYSISENKQKEKSDFWNSVKKELGRNF